MGVNFGSVAALAATQNGRVTTRQLRERGFGNSSIENGIRAGHLFRVHHGVYIVGHRAPSRLGAWHGAVLACGPAAVLSHRCAATLLGIRDGVGPRIDVTVPSSGRRRPGIAVHRARLLPFEIARWSDIPVTSPNRTMVDLAHELIDPEQIEWAMRELQFRRLYDRVLLELSNHRRRNATVARLLDGFAATQSPLEVAFLRRVVRRHHLPVPECQVKLEGFRVDFFWPQAGLIVEVDGRSHDQPLMRQADATRDAVHAAIGLMTLRYRWADVHRRDLAVATEIAARLGERAGFHPGSG